MKVPRYFFYLNDRSDRIKYKDDFFSADIYNDPQNILKKEMINLYNKIVEIEEECFKLITNSDYRSNKLLHEIHSENDALHVKKLFSAFEEGQSILDREMKPESNLLKFINKQDSIYSSEEIKNLKNMHRVITNLCISLITASEVVTLFTNPDRQEELKEAVRSTYNYLQERVTNITKELIEHQKKFLNSHPRNDKKAAH